MEGDMEKSQSPETLKIEVNVHTYTALNEYRVWYKGLEKFESDELSAERETFLNRLQAEIGDKLRVVYRGSRIEFKYNSLVHLDDLSPEQRVSDLRVIATAMAGVLGTDEYTYKGSDGDWKPVDVMNY